MPADQHRWRTLRTKSGATDDAYGGATHPADLVRSASGPLRAIYVYVRPLNSNGDRIAYASSSSETYSIAGVKIADLDNDDTVDASDDAVRTDVLTECLYWQEVRIPMGGALQFGVALTDIVAPTGATQYQVRYREEPLLARSET